jgi:hypothetical protein
VSTTSAPTLVRWSAVLAAALLVLLVPVLFSLLAPPPLATDGPCLAAVAREGATAALDRVERLLSGTLDVRFAAPLDAGPVGSLAPTASCPDASHLAAAPEAVVALATRGAQAELRL